MLWSLLKIVIFVAIVAALTLGAGYVMEANGGIQITAAGYEVNLGPLQSVIAVVVLVVGLFVLFKLVGLTIAVLKFINGDDTALSRYFDRNRERKGYHALSEGLLALSSGEGKLAMAKAQKADRYLHNPALTNLLTAQAAEMSGDTRKAEETYKKLIQNDDTRFAGIRGMMKLKLAQGDEDTALALAERAFAIKPRHREIQDMLLELQVKNHDWKGARKTLSAELKHGNLPRDVYKRRDAVLALSEAKDIFADDKPIEAREAAIASAKGSPDLIPGACMAARAYIARGENKKAERILKKAWAVQPHPDLAATFAEIAPDETPGERVKRFKALTGLRTSHRETKLLRAELALAAEDFPEARRAVGNLADTDADARVLTVMAAIAKGEGAPETEVRGWLTKALVAPRGPAWVCDQCHHLHSEWVPICDNCNGFDTLSWTTPPQTGGAPAGAEMLPLIVGTDPAPAPATDAVPEVLAPNPPTPQGASAADDARPAVEDAEVVTDPGTPDPDKKDSAA
ncbi:heme biosynthesis protein HemY [Salipiger aestuarii]|uniref:HemY protein n=1 Tax=Salipiger aestuarii TaxID=568098 RepID=A0A327YKN6_9RHOB|nr:heme biosynthesis HemY N-terminal domain-containing protein [Salipiger aestuarii]KAA8609917.1 heme biosynthesis protein HemY [Salipiger aestuarii]KAB2543176.1 heme biosynthesis protein HemY [Salipiger aestuarii]RAK21500.1 HemY protein [Salipiger aestuarii]